MIPYLITFLLGTQHKICQFYFLNKYLLNKTTPYVVIPPLLVYLKSICLFPPLLQSSFMTLHFQSQLFSISFFISLYCSQSGFSNQYHQLPLQQIRALRGSPILLGYNSLFPFFFSFFFYPNLSSFTLPPSLTLTSFIFSHDLIFCTFTPQTYEPPYVLEHATQLFTSKACNSLFCLKHSFLNLFQANTRPILHVSG